MMRLPSGWNLPSLTTILLIVIAIQALSLAVVLFLRNRAARARDHAFDGIDEQSAQVREHYETEARKAIDDLAQRLSAAEDELTRLRPYGSLRDAEAEVKTRLAEAVAEAAALKLEARTLLDGARNAALEELAQIQPRVKEIKEKAEALLAQATREAGRIVQEAETRAEQIGGDAYLALREKESLERALKAIRNVIDGYGDRYVVPTRSFLDELAEGLSHTSAGESLRSARDQTRRMAENGEAAACDYAEANRRETAIRFVVDAFNGRVDAILSRVKHDNHGTLAQEIRDSFSLVNHNGEAFRNARVLPAYLDARLAELKWAVAAQELRRKEREEQREIQERIREEEKARREYEKAMQEAARDEATLTQAMVQARAEVEHATAKEREVLERRIADLSARLKEAQEKGQRALSMAQQTRAGNVYVISNIGSFGEDVFKIGMTRRLKPLERVYELGDASVPFEFDVHAMIPADDAPALEHLLHEEFDDLRVNRVNGRKEFFRVPLNRIRELVAERKLTATFTMVAEAREYRQTMALDKTSSARLEQGRVQEPDPDEVA